ncbi:MAG: glutathione S-transferase family protein [Luminiphilus sp.]|nr:glutathione S-transferase family protein [Luminiphilus sp.]
MKLYTFDPAPNPQRLKMFMDYKGIEIDTAQINFQEGEQRTDAYKAVVPTGTVPALVLDSGRVLSSVFAITQYLEALHPDRPLLGTCNEERALILDWNHRIFTDVFKAIGDLLRNSNPAFAGRALPGTLDTEQIPALAERGRSQLLHALTIMNDELSSRNYVAGDSFSMADIDLLASLQFAGWAGKVKPDESLTALIDWRQRAQAALD